MKIRHLLLLSPLTAVLLFGVIIWVSLYAMKSNREELQKISEVDQKILDSANQLVIQQSEIEAKLVESAGDGDKEILKQVSSKREGFLQTLRVIGEKDPKFKERADKLETTFQSYLDQSIQVTTILVDNRLEDFGHERFAQLRDSLGRLKDSLKEELDKLKEDAETSTQERIKHAQLLAERNFKLTLLMVVLSVLVMSVIYFWMNKNVIRPLNRVVNFTLQIGSGDLTGRIENTSQNELGDLARAFNQMVGNLRSIAEQLQQANHSLGDASKDILSAAVQQSNSSNEQAAAINETSATVSELKETSRQSEQRAQEVVETAGRSVEHSRRGTQSVKDSVRGMEGIQDQVGKIASNIMALSEQTEAIGDIISTVNDIAEQSNVLAVNASIEAAKAGEYGRGFEVVAREVKSLADQSKEATSQIRLLLMEIKKATTATVMATEEGQKRAEQGVLLVGQAGENIEKLSEAIEESARAAKQIAITSHQQSVGIDQIAIAIENIRQATTENVASVRQTEKAAKGLNDLAGNLQEISGRYRL